jgi:2-polyprenyl-3-methyl-5-hydroxy-6-metoxy-1,4-benzoquinol methylase
MIDVKEQKKRVRTFFSQDERWKGKLYENQDDRFARAVARRKMYAMEMLRRHNLKAGSVLCVGCGSGLYLKELASQGFTCYGIDLSNEMIQTARKKLEGIVPPDNLVCGDAEHIPMESETFHLVSCVGVLSYLVSDQYALMEMNRVLKVGGILLMSVENLMSLSNIDFVWRSRLRSFMNLRGSHQNNSANHDVSMSSPWVLMNSPTHYNYRLHNPWKLEKMVQSYGFAFIDAMTFGFQFRILRRFKLLPESWIHSMEIFLERLLRKFHIPYFSYSGEAYIALFKKVNRI